MILAHISSKLPFALPPRSRETAPVVIEIADDSTGILLTALRPAPPHQLLTNTPLVNEDGGIHIPISRSTTPVRKVPPALMSPNSAVILKYISLPEGYEPSPIDKPVDFLQKHLLHLPPSLLHQFSHLSPRQRTSIVKIKNRRTTFAVSLEGLRALSWEAARKKDPVEFESYMIRNTGSTDMPIAGDPSVPDRRFRKGEEEGVDERQWAEHHFLGGATQYQKHVGGGKLGSLLGQFEEERESERLRTLRVEKRRKEEELAAAVPEEEDDDDELDDEDENPPWETPAEAHRSFEKIIQERFIDGVLEWMDYDEVDWDDKWDADVGDDEERWFDDEEEG